MKKLFKIFAWMVVVIVAGCAIIFLVAWKSPKYYVVQKQGLKNAYIPFQQYNSNHPRPMILHTKSGVIFGAEHTRNAADTQIALIEKEWHRLKPTVALVEGRLGFLLPGLMNPVETLGEGGKVKELAQKAGVPLYNWDLSKEALAAQLLQHFNAEQIALYQILNPYFSQVRFGKPDAESFLKDFYGRAAYVGLQDSIKNVQDIDRIWTKYFTTVDWRHVSDEGELPGYLSSMMAVTNDLRNQQLIAVVKELEEKGERIFMVCGSSHAVCVAPAFQ
jgi:hypothetical protein